MSIKKQQPISNAAVVDKCTQRLTALKHEVAGAAWRSTTPLVEHAIRLGERTVLSFVTAPERARE